MADSDNKEVLDAIKEGFSNLSNLLTKKEEPPKKDEGENISTIIKNEFTALKDYLKPKDDENKEPKEKDVEVPKIPEPEPDVEDDPIPTPQESNITKFLRKILVG